MTFDATHAAAQTTTAHLAEVAVVLVVGAWVVVRQLRVHRLDPRSTVAWVVLGVGVVEVVASLRDRGVTAGDVAVLVVSAAVGAVLAAARGCTVRLWRDDARVLRQGGVLTAVLWVVSIVQHLSFDARATDRSLAGASLLAYLGLALLVQNLVLVARARQQRLLVGVPTARRAPRDRRDAETPDDRDRRA